MSFNVFLSFTGWCGYMPEFAFALSDGVHIPFGNRSGTMEHQFSLFYAMQVQGK